MSSNNLVESGWDLAINKFAPALPAVKTVRDYITNKSFTAHQFFQDMGLGTDKKDFNDIYYKAMAKLNTHPDVVKVFKDTTIMSYFHDSFGGTITIKGFLDHIHAHLAVNPDLSHLQTAIEKDLDELLVCFLQTIFESMDPETQYTVGQIHAVKADTEELLRVRAQDRVSDLEWRKNFDDKLNTLVGRMPTELSAGKAAYMSQEDFEDNIGPILEQLRKKRNKAAIDLLEVFKARKRDTLTAEQRFKIDFALGQAHLELGNNKEAIAFFVTLPDILPTNPDAMGFAAMGYALQHDGKLAEHYAQKGLMVSPGLPTAVVARVQTLSHSASLQELDGILEDADLTNPMIALNTAEWLVAKGLEHYRRALQIFENANVIEGTLAWAEKLERMAILNAKIAIADFIACGNLLSDDARQRLANAELWLTNAREFYKDTDLRRIKWAITANRGVIRKMAGDYEGAKADLLVAFDEEKNFFLYHHLLVIDMEQGTVNRRLIQEARQHLQLSKEQDEELFIMELNGLLEDKNHREILRLLDERQYEEGDEIAICKLNFFRSLALVNAGDVKGGLKVAKDTADKYPSNPQISHRTADLAIMVRDEKVAHEYASQAVKALGDDPANNILFPVVELCYQLGHYQEVIDMLDKPQFKNRWNRYIEYLVPSLERVGRQGEAVEIVEKFYDPEKPIAFCAQVLIHADERACDYERAFSTTRIAIKHFPEEPFFHGKELAYYIRSNDQRSQDKKLQELVVSNWPVDHRLQALFIAVVSAGQGHFLSGLNTALQMRNEHPDELAGHKGYLNFVMGLINNGFKGIVQLLVVPPCGVELQNAGGDKVNVIIDDSGTVLNAISSTSEKARALIGQMVGATVMLNGTHFQITKILSRFDVAFLDSKVRIENVTKTKAT
jgi:tetratricopeptide (TPR) repeat protein